MREAQIPSYRVRETAVEDGPSRRLLLMAAGMAGTLAVGGLAGWAVTNYADNTIPVVAADERPIKVRPESRGGLQVANQDEIIFERRHGNGSYEVSGRLGPAAEAPNLDALRAATAPPLVQQPLISQAAPAQVTAPVAEHAVTSPPVAVEPASVPAPAEMAVTQPPVPQPARPATPPPAPTVAAPAQPSGSVVVQLGALDSESGARSEWERLGRRVPELGGRTPQIIPFERDGRPTMWRLRTGGFATKDAAGNFCEAVRSRGGVCAVIGG